MARKAFRAGKEIELTATEYSLLEYLMLNLTSYKLDIYRYFSLNDREHRDLLNQFIEESKEEMDFLRKEIGFQEKQLIDERQLVTQEKGSWQ